MWGRMAIGAVVGLIVGHFIAPGYAPWLVIGVSLGYLTTVGLERAAQRRQEQADS